MGGGGGDINTFVKKYTLKITNLTTCQPSDGRERRGTDGIVGGGDWFAAGQPGRNRGVNPTGSRPNEVRYCVFIILLPILYRWHNIIGQTAGGTIKGRQEQNVHKTSYE